MILADRPLLAISRGWRANSNALEKKAESVTLQERFSMGHDADQEIGIF
jgi:hypothetical protein